MDVRGFWAPRTTVAGKVDRTNFVQGLEALTRALAACDFVALDLEFTGTAAGGGATSVDDAHERYGPVAAAARTFLPVQVGLAAFAWDGGKGAYVARTFNFWVYPCTGPAGEGRALGFHPASLAFLAAQGFDFNRWVARGIPFTSAAHRDAALARAAARRERERARPPIMPTRADDVALVADTCSAVLAWLPSDAPTLELPAGNGFQRALVYQTLESAPELAAERGAWTARTNKVGGGGRGRAPITLTRAVPGDAEAAVAAREAEWEDTAREAAGFAAAFEALRDAAVPVVVHNGGLDVAYSLAAFAGPLPSDWEAYVALARSWLPGGVYDTKVLAAALGGGAAFGPSTSLREVYDAAVGASPRPGLDPVPTPRHAPGFDRYERAADAAGGASEGGMAPEASDGQEPAPPPPNFEHEAGFDAFMTGTAFVALARAHAAAKRGDGGATPPPNPLPRDLVALVEAAAAGGGTQNSTAQPVDWEPLAGFDGGLYAFQSDAVPPFHALGPAPQPPPRGGRTHVLYVVPLPKSVSPTALAGEAAKVLGRCRVAPRLGGAAASVECFELGRGQGEGLDGNAAIPNAPTRPPDAAAAAVALLAGVPALAGARVTGHAAYAAWVQAQGGPGPAAVAAAAAQAALDAGVAAPLAALLERVRAKKRRRLDEAGPATAAGGGAGKACSVM